MTEEWKLKVFFDGDCPICCREINWLRKRTGETDVVYENIADPKFKESSDALSYDAAMKKMQALLPDGRVISGVEVFRQLYKHAGLGWLLAPTGWPILRPIFDLLYAIFARYRLRLTGRKCDDGSCAI
ncbi:MAG: DUF393 domain-containing protein [Bdellovibrionales bacterium]|nr:DUF393 domain-containing protein [Bdellovibrionales bacterium]